MGNFKVSVPTTGTYKVEIFNPEFYFEPVVVEITDEEFAPGKDTKAFLFSLTKGKDFRLMYPLVLDPSSKIQYFEPVPRMDYLSYLKNPFVIMIGVTFLLSQLSKSVDPQEMKKAQESTSEQMKDMP